MKDFPPIKNIKLTNDIINKIKSNFKYSSFTMGETIISITPSGGIHFTGKKEKHKLITFEIVRHGISLLISLFEYPHGIIFHCHIYYPQIDKLSKELITTIVVKTYSEIKNLIS